MNCNHKYVDMENGTGDKLCVRCGKKAKQGVLYLEPNIEININSIVDEDDIAKKIAKEISKGVGRSLVRGGTL